MSRKQRESMNPQVMVSTSLDEMEKCDFDLQARASLPEHLHNDMGQVWNCLSSNLNEKFLVSYSLNQPAVISCINEPGPEYIEFTNAFNALMVVEFKKHKSELNRLTNLKEFCSTSETDLVLLHRFAQKREKVLKEHSFIEAKELFELMGSKDKNPSRWIAKQEKNFKIFSVEAGGKKLYPAFQLDRENKPYDSLVESWTKFYKAGRSNWDVCFWLTSLQHVITERVAVSSDDLKGKSIKEAMLLAGKAREQTKQVEIRPIDALSQGKDKIFHLLIQKWLAPDEMNIHTTELEIDKRGTDV